MEEAGQKICELRKKKGLTQTELGQMIGVSKQQIMRYETKGISTMRVHRLYDLAEALETTVSEILDV